MKSTAKTLQLWEQRIKERVQNGLTIGEWSINLLSFGSAEESIMRLDSPNIANELIMSILNRSSIYL
ncbi:hypothetical protein DEAC_c14650 [Desulfosporosinus acididurans]|uniref:Uncharacterized protein n=1 Tax=Desulfosporosinus acididurans TaxID=476652 RepID=A0A0J1FU21_9FIRM|nr:hypothetical protein [Desulfosporosinus acididurans]KLU66797.1 hypothetical protein DEAC_c14650 [Desulfosporosinus acididurans]